MLKLNKKNSQRQLKVSEYLKRSLSQILSNYVYRIDRERYFSVNVSEVNISIDLKIAQVFVIPFSQMKSAINSEEIEKKLREDTYLIRKKLSSNIGLRYTPKIIFRVDDLISESQKIEDLFKDPRIAQDL
tara:strand:+ start:243 stop:632 length:390 start_codon:yes stop_codon:yes gene_type:complete